MNNKQKIIVAVITPEFIEEQAAEIKVLAQKAKGAADAYMVDLDQRKAALEKQAAEYRAQIESKKKQRKALAGKINDLSSRGMIDEAAEADVELEALDKAITTLERKLKLVSTAELKGDPKLYKAAQEANAAMVAGRKEYKDKIAKLLHTVRDEQERLKRLEDDLQWRWLYHTPGTGEEKAFEKVDRHYRDLDRIEREAKERAAAERAAAEKARNIRRII